MSIRVITWVMSDADVQNHGELAVLYALAERAHEDGRYAWPSQAWIAYRARCTARTVRNHLTNLENRGVIFRGDQQVVSHLDPRYRPVVWDIDMTKVRDDPRPERLSSLAKSRAESFAARPENPDTQGGKSGHLGRKPVSYKPSLEPSREPSMNQPPVVPQGETVENAAFDEFWAVYPRHVGRPKALAAFRRAVKRAGSPVPVVDGARELANDPNLPDDKQFIPHPTTWLNRDGWDDEPLPPRLSTNQGSNRTFGTHPDDWDFGTAPDTNIIDGEVLQWPQIEA